ncbi:hypothetical protein L218DRAFT_290923 [Marasmius fiardii PR-910]|nr:hypothetical protein L218DRAFT_290923 [Marasmius fiardii PR-910]
MEVDKLRSFCAFFCWIYSVISNDWVIIDATEFTLHVMLVAISPSSLSRHMATYTIQPPASTISQVRLSRLEAGVLPVSKCCTSEPLTEPSDVLRPQHPLAFWSLTISNFAVLYFFLNRQCGDSLL